MTTLAHPLPTGTAPGRAGRRLGPVRALRHGFTLAGRAVRKIRRNPEQLLDVTLTPLVFVTMFYFLFGGAFNDGDRQGYLQFVLPGIMVQTMVFASSGTGINLATDITKGVFDRFRSLPIARSGPLVGLILGDVVRYTICLAILIGYGTALGFRFHTDPLAVLAGFGLILFFSLSLCWVWALGGLSVRSPQSMQGLGFVIGFPLTFGSNIFVPTDTLPGWLQAWVKVNPVTALTDATRGLMVGGPVARPALITLAWAVAILAVFAPLAVQRYRRRS